MICYANAIVCRWLQWSGWKAVERLDDGKLILNFSFFRVAISIPFRVEKSGIVGRLNFRCSGLLFFMILNLGTVSGICLRSAFPCKIDLFCVVYKCSVFQIQITFQCMMHHLIWMSAQNLTHVWYVFSIILKYNWKSVLGFSCTNYIN